MMIGPVGYENLAIGSGRELRMVIIFVNGSPVLHHQMVQT